MELWSWVLSIIGLVGIWLAGNKSWEGWAIMLGSEVLWVVYALQTQQLGFILGSVTWSLVYVRNIAEWRREQAAREALHRALTEPVNRRGRRYLVDSDVREALHDLEG